MRVLQKVSIAVGMAVWASIAVLVVLTPRPSLATGPADDYCFSQEECTDKNGDFTLPGSRDIQCPPNKGLCYAKPTPVNLSVAIGGNSQALDLSDYLAQVFNYAIGVVAVVAGILILVGGFQYLTAGDSGRVSDAKERITNALLGMLLALGSYLILQTINPALVALQLPKLPMIKTVGMDGVRLTSCSTQGGASRLPTACDADRDCVPSSVFKNASVLDASGGLNDAKKILDNCGCFMVGNDKLEDLPNRIPWLPRASFAPSPVDFGPDTSGQKNYNFSLKIISNQIFFSKDSDISAYQSDKGGNKKGFCTALGKGLSTSQLCTSDQECGSKQCKKGILQVDALRLSAASSGSTYGLCVDGKNFSFCATSSDCNKLQSPKCISYYNITVCSDGTSGAPCDFADPSTCRSGLTCDAQTKKCFK